MSIGERVVVLKAKVIIRNIDFTGFLTHSLPAAMLLSLSPTTGKDTELVSVQKRLTEWVHGVTQITICIIVIGVEKRIKD